ncbi:MAG: hypothetical protein KDA88_14030 [Planctomycetaceae bacterium]|nr:hypothetical protein [Planctomycetaceae bacterium]MCB9951622.1 response regulator [Planctomycetaceae bacterium]
MAATLLDVGNCSADHSSMSSLCARLNAGIVRAHSVAEALRLMREQPFALVTVNRILDRDGSEGMELIEEMQQDEALKDIPVMLISNYGDAQQAARAAGAVKGFGKSKMFSPETEELLRGYLKPDQ